MPLEEDLILVTGASGFVATHIIQQLLQTGYRVRGTVRSLKNDQKVKPLYELCPESNDKLELVECDLLDEQCWPAAVKDCTHVLHTASPFPASNPKNEDELIKPAVDGTLFVLKACQEAGTVKRVVLTSSMAAIAYRPNPDGRVLTEDDWSDLDDPSVYPYIKSKTLAEKAAWDFVNSIEGEKKIELATINPTYIMGPVLCGSTGTSMELPIRLLTRDMPMLPDIYFGICDVRDVAKAHIKAMTIPESVGHRHIVDNGTLSLKEIAIIIDKEFRPQGYNVPTTVAPKFLMRIAALFEPSVRMLLPSIGRRADLDNCRLVNVLGITPYPKEKSILDICYSVIETGRVKKTRQYHGPK